MYLVKPKEYYEYLVKPKEYYEYLVKPKEYYEYLVKPKEYYEYLVKPKEYYEYLVKPKTNLLSHLPLAEGRHKQGCHSQEKYLENKIFPRSGKSQGILWMAKEI